MMEHNTTPDKTEETKCKSGNCGRCKCQEKNDNDLIEEELKDKE